MKENTIIRRQFFHALKRGTGEAYLLVRDHPEVDFSGYLIKGAVKNHAYDGQAEGSRAAYIFEIISISRQQAKIRKAIFQAIQSEKEDTWSLVQLFDLLKLYAQKGDEEARQAMYDRFYQNTIDGSEWAGFREILQLDGLKGLIFITKKAGQYLQKNPEAWEDDGYIRSFQELYPEVDAWKALGEAAKENASIRFYLDHIAKHSQTEKERPPYTFQSLLDEIENSERNFIFPRMSMLQKASSAQIEVLGRMFLQEKDLSRKERILSVFRKVKFPFDYQVIFTLAKQKPTVKHRLVEYAKDALRHFKGEDILDFALEKMRKSRNPEGFIPLLEQNYREEDGELLTEIVHQFRSEYKIENLAFALTDLFKIVKSKSCAAPLIVLYQKMNCGIHRADVVRILMENQVLPDIIKREIPYDSYMETRGLFNSTTKAAD
jgi:hypothetical protein